MASALSPGKGASDAHTAPSADILEKKIEGNEKSVTGDKSAVNVSNMVDTHFSSSALEDTSRCADGIEAKQDFATPAEKSHPVESGDKTTSARVFTEHDIDAFVRERLEEAGCSDSFHKDPACCSANHETTVQDAQDTGIAKCADVIHSAVSDQEGANTSKRCGQSNSSQSTSAIHANIQAEGNNGLLEDTDHQKSRGVDGAIQSPATSTEEAPRVFPDVNTGHGNHHDFTDNVLTALLYIIGALILIIIFRRALLSQLFSANDDPGEL